jgi:hypothetical protein
MEAKEQEPTGFSIVTRETSFLQPFRKELLQRPAVTMPPHVTIGTFLPASSVDEHMRRRLRTFFKTFSKFSFKLERIGRFLPQGVLYLVPEETDCFYELYEGVCKEFALERNHPAEPTFHLTLAGWHPHDLDRMEREFQQRYNHLLPIHARATDVTLYERIEGKRWKEDSVYALR